MKRTRKGMNLDNFGRTFGGKARKAKMLSAGSYPFKRSDDIDDSYFGG